MALTSITQVLSATSSGSTINFPVGIQAGDLIVLLDRATTGGGAGVPADVTPSGFTRVGTSLNISALTSVRQNAWYKLATGSETGSLTGMNGATANQKIMVIFRGNEAAVTLTLGGSSEQITNNDPTAQNCTASAGVAPLVVIGCYGSGSAVSPRTFSTTADGEVTESTTLYLAWKIYNSSPANSSIDMDDEGTNNALQSFYIQMAGTAATNVDGAASSAGVATAAAVGEAVLLMDGVMSAAATATAAAVGNSLADAVMSTAGVATAVGVGSSLVDGVMSASGAATAIAVGASNADAVMNAAGAATATAVGSSLLVVEGAMSAAGAATAAAIAADGGVEIEVPRQPVGGGAGGMMAGGDDRQRFRMRKEKSQPHVIRVGEWPTEAELAALLQDEQREFSQFIAGLSQEEDDKKPATLADQEEDALILLLSAA